TEQAIAAGVFGVPTMIVDGELFWGYDSFAHLEGFLRGEDPLQPGDLERWAHLPASAGRG
ncbi:MAG TPA: DsbA family protein, partial [Myxococcota bacterium]|nr:DsbA family protein [Myxococcota bacterium]